MSILDNEWVRKYFGLRRQEFACCPNAMAGCGCMALRVLTAMEQPIKKGDRYLYSHNGPEHKGRIFEDVAPREMSPWWQITGICLRLPDRFQEKKCEHDKFKHRCCGCDEVINIVKPDPVEAKIAEMSWAETNNAVQYKSGKALANDLRDLVQLARETK